MTGDWETALARHGRVEVGYRRGRTLLVVTVAGLLTAGSALVAVTGDGSGDRMVGVLGATFFGLVAIALVRRLVPARPAVVVSGTGVGSPTEGWSVPWEVVHGAFVHRTRRTAVVCLVVDPGWLEQHLAGRGAAARVRAQGVRRMLGPEVMSLPTSLAVDEEAWAAWLGSKALAGPPDGRDRATQ